MFANPRHEANREAQAAEVQEIQERRRLTDAAADFTPEASCDSRNHGHRRAACARRHLDVIARRDAELDELRRQSGEVERRARQEIAEAAQLADDTRSKLDRELADEARSVLYPIAERFARDFQASQDLIDAWIVLDARAQVELGEPLVERQLMLAFAAGAGVEHLAGEPPYIEGEQGPSAWAARLVTAIKTGAAIEVHAVGVDLMRAVWKVRARVIGSGNRERVEAMKRAATPTFMSRAIQTRRDSPDAA